MNTIFEENKNLQNEEDHQYLFRKTNIEKTEKKNNKRKKKTSLKGNLLLELLFKSFNPYRNLKLEVSMNTLQTFKSIQNALIMMPCK